MVGPKAKSRRVIEQESRTKLLTPESAHGTRARSASLVLGLQQRGVLVGRISRHAGLGYLTMARNVSACVRFLKRQESALFGKWLHVLQ